MEIQVNRLDDAYKSANYLNSKTLETSKKLSSQFEEIINNIKIHWVGADASNFINRCIDEYERYSTYFSSLNGTVNYIQNYFVSLQECRAKTSNITNIGDSADSVCEFNRLQKMETTNEYSYDEQLKRDYFDLSQLNSIYDRYIGTLENYTGQIFSNWIVGTGRNEMESQLQELITVSRELSKEFHILNNDFSTILRNTLKIDY